MLVLTLATLTSCEKDLYAPTLNQEEKKVTDLIIPNHFDWEMTKAASCYITSNHSTQFSIYLDEACSNGNLLANVTVKAGATMKLPLSLLKNTQQVYVQYSNDSGNKTTTTATVDAHNNIHFAAPASSKRATTRSESDFEERGGTLYYPKAEGGTIMFEDSYPALGDYDFNDFVARYVAEVHTTTISSASGREDTFVNEIEFRMEVIAIGGVTPYVPCLRLPFSSSSVEHAKASAAGGGLSNEIQLEQTIDKSLKENIVLLLSGAEKNDTKPSGSPFLNTEKGFATVNTKRINLTVTFKPYEALLSDLTSNLFDIFLCAPDRSKEIHLLGYGAAFEEGNESFIYDPTKNNTYKQVGSNLVWAINIPNNSVSHTFEKANFLNAYPEFATWAESGGASTPYWYNNPASSENLFK